MKKTIAIIGAGSWGTALAQILSGDDDTPVILYARDTGLAEQINTIHENKKYLPDVTLHKNIRATNNLADAKDCTHVLLATPAQFLRETLQRMMPFLTPGTPLINCAKGIEISTGKLLSEMVAETAPRNPYVSLSGPTFAIEAAKGLPTALTLASAMPAQQLQSLAESLRRKTFRPYISHDPVGADIAGAIKNVIAIACGIVEGRHLGQNAKAAVMTRGMAEIKRMGMAKGALAETFLGLSGIGDLMLTCSSMASRNFSLGFELGQGRPFDEIINSRQGVAEGVATAKALAAHAAQTSVEMPICIAVNAILHKGAEVDDIVTGLLAREIKEESI